MHLDRFLTTGGSRAATIAFTRTQSTKQNKTHSETERQRTCLIEHVLETLLSECGALDVLDRTKFTRETLSLFGGDRSLLLSLEFLHHLRVIA